MKYLFDFWRLIWYISLILIFKAVKIAGITSTGILRKASLSVAMVCERNTKERHTQRALSSRVGQGSRFSLCMFCLARKGKHFGSVNRVLVCFCMLRWKPWIFWDFTNVSSRFPRKQKCFSCVNGNEAKFY